MRTIASSNLPAVTAREQWMVSAVAFVIAPLAALVLAGSYYFARPFWSDEVLSWLIATDPSFDHGMAALAGGVDTNAPLVHLLFRALGLVFGAAPIVYRLASLVAMGTAIVGLYLTLRRSVKPSAAAFGCLCFAALPIVIAHTTEARFYAFELAAAVWTNLLITRRPSFRGTGVPPMGFEDLRADHGRDARATASSSVALALTSVALCGVHYFGVIALGCIVLADLFRERTTIIAWLDRVWPTVAGFAMTACMLPLVIAQRTAMRDAGGTWVPDTFVKNLRATLDMLLPGPTLMIGSVVALISIAFVGRSAIVTALREHRAMLIAAAGYLMLMLAFDRFVQPVFVPRYFIVALPAVAAIGAAFASRWPTMITRFAVAALSLSLCVQWWQIRLRSHTPDGRAAAGLLASVSGVEKKTPIVSDWLGHALPIIQSRPDLGGRVAYVADHRLHEVGFDSAIRYEREMAACVQRFYGLPAEATLARLDRLQHFVLLTEYPETVGERFPRYEARRLGTVAFDLTRKNDTSAKAE